MYGLVMAWLYGFVVSWFFKIGMLIATSAAFFVTDVALIISRGSATLIDVALMFAYLTALQSGFLIGAYVRNGLDRSRS